MEKRMIKQHDNGSSKDMVVYKEIGTFAKNDVLSLKQTFIR